MQIQGHMSDLPPAIPGEAYLERADVGRAAVEQIPVFGQQFCRRSSGISFGSPDMEPVSRAGNGQDVGVTIEGVILSDIFVEVLLLQLNDRPWQA